MTDARAWQAPDMSSYRAHLRELDRLVLRLAHSDAMRLRLAAIGPEVIVLAILHPEAGDSIAAQVLRECGLDRGICERRLEHYRAQDGRDPSPQLNPAAVQLGAMAEGIAAGLGARTVTAEHVLLAAIWDPSFYSERREPSGPTREQLRDALARRGFALPHAELPSPNPRRFGPPFFLPADQMYVAVGELRHVLPKGASFGCNTKPDTGEAFVIVDEGLDAKHYVRLALARHQDSLN
jgi:hypothetical protein